jgi:photosystem II stability/assembly factor-like uncharacterized protein
MLLIAAGVVAAQPQIAAPVLPQQQPVWQMQDSGTMAGLRGIDSVDGTVAWASGTEGTVLKTTDGGAHWLKCAVPDAATDGATLDFRGVQAWDATTAIVMASGPGDKSRLYKTVDGCRSWSLLLQNQDKDGFWDGIVFDLRGTGFLLGDPVAGKFVLLFTLDKGKTWNPARTSDLASGPERIGGFAASNSAMTLYANEHVPIFGTSGPRGPWLYSPDVVCTALSAASDPVSCYEGGLRFDRQVLPMAGDSASSGIFSVQSISPGFEKFIAVAVGGDYTKPGEGKGTAAWSEDLGQHWTASTAPPHGYRSTVQWSANLKLWFTAGTNGSDISRDDGRTWRPLDDGNWNALSLPFIVGPKGRIARLNSAAIQPEK